MNRNFLIVHGPSQTLSDLSDIYYWFLLSSSISFVSVTICPGVNTRHFIIGFLEKLTQSINCIEQYKIAILRDQCSTSQQIIGCKQGSTMCQKQWSMGAAGMRSQEREQLRSFLGSALETAGGAVSIILVIFLFIIF